MSEERKLKMVTKDNYTMIYHRLPEVEKDMPVVMWDDLALSWRQLFYLQWDEPEVAKMLIKKIDKMLSKV